MGLLRFGHGAAAVTLGAGQPFLALFFVFFFFFLFSVVHFKLRDLATLV
jgi:hypothetical protein